MLRDAQIPFLLWLPAALMAHAVGGGGAQEAAAVVSGRADILAFARNVREDVRSGMNPTITVTLLDETAPEDEAEPEDDDDSSDDDADVDEDAEADEDDAEAPKPEKTPPPKATPPPKLVKRPPPPKKPKPKPKPKPKKKAVAPKPKPPEKKPKPKPKPKPKVAKKDPPKKKAEKKDVQKLELPKPDGRIAVINDPNTKKDQKDNPNAKRIADNANTVKEETMARFRSYDQNASKPTGGGEPNPSPLKNPGNANDEKRGFSNEVAGEKAPRAGTESGPPKPPKKAVSHSPKGSKSAPKAGRAGKSATKAVKGQEAGKGPSAPEVAAAGGAGNWSISADASGDGKKKQKGRKARKGSAGRAAIPGLPGAPKAGTIGPMYSINAYGLQEALGKEHLRREQEKARNTRLARHRGSFKANQFQKYRAAIENYNPSVKPGNQTSLNAARVPFASYINMMHNRLHPIFADGFLGGLNKLPADDKLANMKLTTHVEIVLDGESGAVKRAGIVRNSGVTAFDAGAIASIHSAGPFGPAPDVIVSKDGNVYVHWEFYRDPYYACTSKFASPYLINAPPPKDDPEPPPKEPRKGEQKGSESKPLRPEKK